MNSKSTTFSNEMNLTKGLISRMNELQQIRDRISEQHSREFKRLYTRLSIIQPGISPPAIGIDLADY